MSSFKLFKIAELVSRLGTVASANRFDQVTRNIHATYEGRMAQNPSALVTSDDLKETYSNFCGLDTQSNFKDHFEDVFSAPQAEEKPADESVFGRDNYTEERNSLPSTSAAADITDSIKEASLERIKDVTSSVLSVPEYHFAGYTKVAKMGDSGLAMWNVKFPTAQGTAAISVPVPVVDGFAHSPVSFFTSAGSTVPFKTADLTNFSKTYTGIDRAAAEQHSGLSVGGMALIPTAQMQETEPTETANISMNFSIPVDEDASDSLSNIQSKIQDAIDKAKCELESKLSGGGDGTATINLSINYSGALNGEESVGEAVAPEGFEHYPEDSQVMGEVAFDGEEGLVLIEGPPAPEDSPFQGVIAFNVSNGKRIATVPVEVRDGGFKIESFYDSSGTARVLTAQAVSDYFEEDVSVAPEDTEQEAFSDAFLSSDASLNELRKEIKTGIDGGNLARANAMLTVVASRYGADASNVTKEYFQWIDDAKNGRETKIAWLAEKNQLSNEDIFITR